MVVGDGTSHDVFIDGNDRPDSSGGEGFKKALRESCKHGSGPSLSVSDGIEDLLCVSLRSNACGVL